MSQKKCSNSNNVGAHPGTALRPAIQKGQHMEFFIPLEKIPTVTAQTQRIATYGGKPRVYKHAQLVDAEQLFIAHLAPHAPEHPATGPCFVFTTWLFQTTDKSKAGQWKTTKPDTDNLLKMFKDCMTKVGFWKDDAQVVYESTQKMYAASKDEVGIFVQVKELDK